LERSKNNQLEFGFGQIPTMSVEDIIIAKLYAATYGESRHQDLDDVQNILRAKPDLDLAYLTNQLNKFSLDFPKSLWEDASEGLRRIGRQAGSKKSLSR
jgi:hypothetical protein